MDLIFKNIHQTLKKVVDPAFVNNVKYPQNVVSFRIVLPLEEDILSMIEAQKEYATTIVRSRTDFTQYNLMNHELLHIFDPFKYEYANQLVSDFLKEVDEWDSEIVRAFTEANIDIVEQLEFWSRISCLKNMIKT